LIAGLKFTPLPPFPEVHTSLSKPELKLYYETKTAAYLEEVDTSIPWRFLASRTLRFNLSRFLPLKV
jgi:hypothetical protein